MALSTANNVVANDIPYSNYKKRSLKNGLLKGDSLKGLDEKTQLLAIALITVADDEGRIPMKINNPYEALANELYGIRSRANSVEIGLEELQQVGYIHYYDTPKGYAICLPGWGEYQKIQVLRKSAIAPCPFCGETNTVKASTRKPPTAPTAPTKPSTTPKQPKKPSKAAADVARVDEPVTPPAAVSEPPRPVVEAPTPPAPQQRAYEAEEQAPSTNITDDILDKCGVRGVSRAKVTPMINDMLKEHDQNTIIAAVEDAVRSGYGVTEGTINFSLNKLLRDRKKAEKAARGKQNQVNAIQTENLRNEWEQYEGKSQEEMRKIMPL